MTPNPATIFNNLVVFDDISESDTLRKAEWSFGNGKGEVFFHSRSRATSTYSEVGNYEVVLSITTIYGCFDSDTSFLRVDDEYTFYAPDAFTPGKDNRNDWFYPRAHGINEARGYLFAIYDRWGQLIYETTEMPKGTTYAPQDIDNPNECNCPGELQGGWNGRYNNTGKFVQNDVYSWFVKLTDINGIPHEQWGKVVVIR